MHPGSCNYVEHPPFLVDRLDKRCIGVGMSFCNNNPGQRMLETACLGERPVVDRPPSAVAVPQADDAAVEIVCLGN